MAKYLDENGLLYVWGKIKNLLSGKQDKLSAGSHISLSGNTISASFSNATTSVDGLMSKADKSKLDGVAAGADVSAVKSVKVNGTALTPDSSKAVNVTVAAGSANGTIAVNGADVAVKGLASGAYADKVTVDSSLSTTSENAISNKAVANAINAKANTSSPVFSGTPTAPTAAAGTKTTQIATTAFVSSAISTALADMTGVKFSIVTTLPTTGAAGTFYLVAHSHSDDNDGYDEYVWLSDPGKFEKIGNTDVDLSGYIKTTDITAIANTEIDTICA